MLAISLRALSHEENLVFVNPASESLTKAA